MVTGHLKPGHGLSRHTQLPLVRRAERGAINIVGDNFAVISGDNDFQAKCIVDVEKQTGREELLHC